MVDLSKRYLLEQGDVSRPATGRPVIYARNGVVSSGHYLTSMAGMRLFLSGGNAFDALVAATFAAVVVEPTASCSLGAESTFMLYHAPSGDFLALSGQGPAGAKAVPEYFRSRGHEAVPTGPGEAAPLSFTVPGLVASCLSLLSKYGTKTVADVLAPAIEYADDGIPHYEYMLSRLEASGSIGQFKLFPPGGLEIFFDDGKLPAPGTPLVQTALGAVLRKLVAAEACAGGHRERGIGAACDSYYRGEVADLIATASESVGGALTKTDLESYEAQYSSPVSTSFQGYEIHGQSTWTQGPVLMQALNILQRFDLLAMGHNTPQYIHTIVEALKLAFADREAFYGDPDSAVVPIDGLLSNEYAGERSQRLDLTTAAPAMPAHGNPWHFSSVDGATARQPTFATSDDRMSGPESGTTHISVADRKGNMVCATPSGGVFNKSVFFPELGFAPSTRSEVFNLVEGHPNCVEPGKRPRTTIINYMVTRDGEPLMTIGCPGGDAQPQANLQLVLNTLLWNMNPQEAVEAPRFSSLSVPNSFYPHSYLRGQLALEEGFSRPTIDALKSMGHVVVPAVTCGMGATVTKRNPETGVMATGADPRRSCYAVGW